MSETKTHYRKVFKSDHLGVADLEEFKEDGSDLIFTISHVKQVYGAKVAGRTIDANIAYFKENIKPMVVNSINSKALKDLCGGSPFVEDWINIDVQLYIDATAKLKGEVVGGVRISSPKQRRKVKAELTPESPKWEGAVGSVRDNGNVDLVLQYFNVSDENLAKLKEAANVA